MDDYIRHMYFSAVIHAPNEVCHLISLPDPDFRYTVFMASVQTEIMGALIAGKNTKEQKFILAGALEACDTWFMKSCLKSLLENIKEREGVTGGEYR